MPSRHTRLCSPPVAALIAPIVGVPFVLIVVVAATDFQRYGGDFRFSWSNAVREGVGMSMYAVPIAWVMAFSVGLFIDRMLEDANRTRWWLYAIAGAIAGAIPFVLFDLASLFGSSLSVLEAVRRGIGPAAAWLLMGVACGASTATIFWALAANRR